MWFAAGSVMGLSLMVAQAMTTVMRTVYARGDFELLFASPIAPMVVLGSRALALAFEGAASGALVLLPLANMGALLGQPKWLAIYPWLMASALVGAALGLCLAMALLVVFGPRHARWLSQVAATLVGASYILTAQVISLLPASRRESITAMLSRPEPGSWLDHNGLLWLPVRAALAEPQAMAAWLLFAVVLFAASLAVCGPRITRVVALADGLSSIQVGRPREQAFAGGLAATLRTKERKLILRDPWLLSQLLLQIVFTLPLAIVLWRTGGITGSAGGAFAPSIVMIAAQVSGSLAWVALSGEDAPEFLATAPVTRWTIERAKLEAIALPIALLLAVPILGLALASPWGALCATVFALGAGVSTALVNFWRQAPAKRGMVLQRHSQSKLVGLIELLLMLLWTVACAVTILKSWIALIPASLAALVLWFNRPRARPAR